MPSQGTLKKAMIVKQMAQKLQPKQKPATAANYEGSWRQNLSLRSFFGKQTSQTSGGSSTLPHPANERAAQRQSSQK